MVLDERSRHELYLKLEQVLGPEPAQTLMEHLPPVGWADVATKRDLDQLAALTKRDLDQLEERVDQRFKALEERMGLRFQALEERMELRFQAVEERIDLRGEALEHKVTAALKGELATQTRTVVFAVLGSVLGSTSLSLLAARIAA
jgi:CRISPR/Cas system type I-B associated protein Csh2 (Cas7 group RAMP superfamily)